MPVIKSLSSRKILDSKSEWTIETTLDVGGFSVVASVPRGTSVGNFEAKSLPVGEALQKIKGIGRLLIGKEFDSQEALDNFLLKLDGTENKRNLGANAILSVSNAFARAMARYQNIPLYEYIANCYGADKPLSKPKIMMLIFEGGKHGSTGISIQEFMVVVDSVEDGDSVYDLARKTLLSRNLEVEVGLEGAFSPTKFSNEEILDFLASLSEYKIALDIAADSAYDNINFGSMLEKYNILSIEDPFGDKDWVKWAEFTRNYGRDILVVGDDLVATNPTRIKKAIELGACNAVIIKPNQIGTLTETLKAVRLAKEGGLKTIVSHRSGETNDSFIADLAVGIRSDFVKFGAPSRGERVAKYNRLLEIFAEVSADKVGL